MAVQAERRLAAVMFTDVVGYTTLGQRDEPKALELLEKYRQLLRPIFYKHRGREVKTMGDGFLVEFASALEATLCAIDIQGSVHSQNLERGEKLLVRVGIHLGDVIRQDDDLLGDAVNVASRIEPLAKPGGICISGQVHDHVKNKISYPLVKIEPRQLKNVVQAVDIYSIVLPWEQGDAEVEAVQTLDRKRVAVLPLVSLSPDPGDEYFADGITEELISTMSNIAGLQVISRTSVMHFKKTTRTMMEIARELGAGSILEGSVRRSSNKVRVTVQLIDSNADTHVWAKSYDRELEDIFAIQSDISMSIAESLRVQLLESERKRVQKAATSSADAHLLYLKGRYFWNERSRAGLEKAVEYFRMAIEKDPGYALAYSGLADCYSVLSDHGYWSSDRAYPEALRNAKKSVELDESLSEAHASLGLIFGNSRNKEMSKQELRRAIEINPSNAYAHMWYSLVAPDPDEAIRYAERAAELDPLNLQIGSSLGANYYYALRLDKAITQLKKVMEMGPDFAPAHLWIALAYLVNGQPEEAIREARVVEELNPDVKALLASILASAGRREEAQKIAEDLERSSEYVDPADMARLYGVLGARDKEVVSLQRASEENSAHLTYYANDPATKELRKDPTIMAILEKAGFPIRR